MPIEVTLLEKAPYKFEACPKCGERFPAFLRGQVQRSKRFLWILWKRPYCAVICPDCKFIIGWESPAEYYGRNWQQTPNPANDAITAFENWIPLYEDAYPDRNDFALTFREREMWMFGYNYAKDQKISVSHKTLSPKCLCEKCEVNFCVARGIMHCTSMKPGGGL